jgi:hypothetical protein
MGPLRHEHDRHPDRGFVICCVDVDYQPVRVTAASVGFAAWADGLAIKRADALARGRT